ncbi:MAG: helix-turn-helix transcriptional regulator [Tissierellia bacterium]|jgi:putative transcriptional regulator|nr:helix-turn-helix transcriptional regulator [Tissierellia bacterium]
MENKVAELRKIHGLSQEAFAKKILVSRQTVSSIENGVYNPSLELAFAIAEVFGMKIEDIFIYKGDKDNEKK